MLGNVAPCWGRGDAHTYFEQILQPQQCVKNWHEGTGGRGPSGTPRYSAPVAPALLGFDESIWDYCTSVRDPGFWGSDDWNVELVTRCVGANLNILRLMIGYNMCSNLQWVVCALRGNLSGQGGQPLLKFAHAPRDLDVRDLADPARRNGWWTEPHESHYAVSDVYFAEIIIISTVCANSWRLFSVRRGESFECEWSESGWHELASALTASSARFG